tara:strand:+ start:1014 stop:1133 length:120 start_codon:yes stop_codon:yes gene_type:complete
MGGPGLRVKAADIGARGEKRKPAREMVGDKGFEPLTSSM